MTRERRRRTAERNVRILEPAKCDNVSLVASTAAQFIIRFRHNGSRRRFTVAILQIGRGIQILRARSRRTETNVTLSANHERIHATHRRAAVELATCSRQCMIALQSNFCRHRNRMVNPQATFSHLHGRRLQSAHWGARSRPLPQRCFTVPVRSVRYRAREGVCTSVQL